MYAVSIGENMVRVAEKEDAMTLVNILFNLDCDERISSKQLTKKDETVEKKEAK